MKKLILVTMLLLSTVFTYSQEKEWVFEVSPRDIQMYSSSKLERPKYFMEKFNIKNMINLSFFNSRTFVGPYKDSSRSSYKPYKNWPVFIIENGEAYIYDGTSWGQSVNLESVRLKTTYVVCGYPLLLKEGTKTKIRNSFFSKRRCPRTAIGLHSNGSVIIYVTKRATLKELQNSLLSLGCIDAINVDGGSSTFIYSDGKKLFSSNEGKSYPNVLSWK